MAGHGLALVPGWWRPAGADVRVVPLTDPPWAHRVEALVRRPEVSTWLPLIPPPR